MPEVERKDDERLTAHEVAVLCHRQAFLAACKREGMDDVTFLSSLGTNVGSLLLEYPEHAEPWLLRLSRQIEEERELREHEPS